jgi:putative SOS response-associated peptidase YedK
MCGRITLTTDKDDIQSRWGYVDPEGNLLKPRYNISPSQKHPIVTVKEDQRVLTMMRWGLVPFWAKNVSTGYKMINAKAETLTTKASFRTPFKKRRCLVLADGRRDITYIHHYNHIRKRVDATHP